LSASISNLRAKSADAKKESEKKMGGLEVKGRRWRERARRGEGG